MEDLEIKLSHIALASVAQWTEHWAVKERVTGSIPSQGTYPGCGPGPQVGACKRHLINVSLTHDPSLSPFPSL